MYNRYKVETSIIILPSTKAVLMISVMKELCLCVKMWPWFDFFKFLYLTCLMRLQMC